MHFEEEERDPFEAFAATESGEETPGPVFTAQQDPETNDQDAPTRVKTAFSWAGFAGGLAALVWIGGAIGGPLSLYGVEAVLTLDPAMQAGIVALAFGPALLFWIAASAAGEALKARRLAVELTYYAREARSPVEASEKQAQRLSNTVKIEIEALNEAVACALDRLGELETAAQRNSALFGDAVAASRENTEAMTDALARERDALVELNGDLRGQTETVAHSIGRQVRLMREASKLVKTEMVAAEDALENHLAAFAASATIMGERTMEFQHVANDAAHASTSLNATMSGMLEGLGEATRLTDAARQSAEQAVFAANETASAVRETTRSAVHEAKRAAQLIRAETVALQDAAADTLAKLQCAAQAAREASKESQAAADHHAAAIQKRLGALAATAKTANVAQRTSALRPVARATEHPAEQVIANDTANITSLHAAASAAMARGSVRSQARAEAEPRRAFKGFDWTSFVQQPRTESKAANEDGFGLVDFAPARTNPDAALKSNAIDLIAEAGVDLDAVLRPADLNRIARSSRDGAASRRRAVLDAAPTAVGRVARHVRRHDQAQSIAAQFRARPDLAKSADKTEGSELVRAYLLIDAALA
ncbi:MAG: hypothetical protein ABL864_15095 [Terricaulis sp.]